MVYLPYHAGAKGIMQLPPKPSGPVAFIKQHSLNLATRHWQHAFYAIFGLMIVPLNVLRS